MMDVNVTPRGLTFMVTVIPRSSKAAIVGCHDGALKIKLTAAPVGGAANKQCIQLMAKSLAVPKSALEIVGGHTHRRKQISIRSGQVAGEAGGIQALKDKLIRLGKKTV